MIAVASSGSALYFIVVVPWGEDRTNDTGGAQQNFTCLRSPYNKRHNLRPHSLPRAFWAGLNSVSRLVGLLLPLQEQGNPQD
jgi:hypothetical protein